MRGRHSGVLIGYADIGDVNTNYTTLQKSDEIATHMLVFPLRSIFNPFIFTLENFATFAVTGPSFLFLFWKAVIMCEQNRF